jgi:hypothetical protein
MFSMIRLNCRPSLLSVLSSAATLLFLAGFAACLVCDLDSCCEDTEHEQEEVCACACAFHSIPVITGPKIQSYASAGAELVEGVPDPDTAPLQSLFRPPRA